MSFRELGRRAAWIAKPLTHGCIVVGMFLGALAAIGVAQRAGLFDSGSASSQRSAAGAATAGRYICPMMCTPPLSQPGRCPVCGMELVEATQKSGDGLSVTIEPATRRLAGIRTAVAKKEAISQTIRTIGSIDFDASRLATISADVDGRLEALYANYVGVPVNRDDDLALIYSPDLYTAQVEYLTALKGTGLQRLRGASDFVELSRSKLIELGLTEDQVEEVKARGKPESRVRLRSPITGTVTAKHAVEGDYVKTGDKIYQVADLTSVWLMLELFPDDAARVRFGQRVQARVNSMPDRDFDGRVAFIDRTVDPVTRTVQVRVEMPNEDLRLRPGDYATARVSVPAIRGDRVFDASLAGKYISPMHPQIIRDAPGDCPVCGMDLISTVELGYAPQPLPEPLAVTVPRSAVLIAGDHSVAYVESEPGRFSVRKVTLGPMNEDRAIVLEGIREGESVATDGNFLIDSQMQLAGNPSLLDPTKAPSYPPGPIKLPESIPTRLTGEAATLFDDAFAAYFAIQRSLALDQVVRTADQQRLLESLERLSQLEIPSETATQNIWLGRDAAAGLIGDLAQQRQSFRRLSHALLRAANEVRGDATSQKLLHMHCPMVPGGGGDWMQPESELRNPYWGSEMLECGETVRDLSIPVDAENDDA